jgi:hypothetical protein
MDGKQLTREEALKVARGIMEDAEKERDEIAEAERDVGLQYNNDKPWSFKAGKGRELYVTENTKWMRENNHKYPGKWVALRTGEAVCIADDLKTIRDYLDDERNGVGRMDIHVVFKIPPLGHEDWDAE